MQTNLKARNKMSVKTLVKISLLGVIAFILMFARMPVFFAPAFMDIDVSEMPALIASFSLGPVAGFLVVILKILLKTLFQGTSTHYVGELSNIIVSSALVIPAGIIYSKRKTIKMAIVSLVVGIIMMSIVATLSNYFIIFPLYGKILGLNLQDFANMLKEINPFVKDYKSLMLFAIVPFNILKGIITSVLTLLLYKRIAKYIKRDY